VVERFFEAFDGFKEVQGQFIFEMPPQPLDGIELGAGGRLKDESEVFGDFERLSAMEGSLIQEHDIKCVRECLSKFVNKGLETGGVEMRDVEKEALSRLGLDGTIEIKISVFLLKGGDGLNAFGRNDAAQNRHEPESAFVLREDFNRKRLFIIGLRSF
jgi:hypothetical protein